MPGLIEGASEGIGLGHEFLAHLERARSLVHVIDASKPADEQWQAIDGELAAYGAGLDELPQIVVLNKIDLEPEPEFGIVDARIVAVFPVSCATGAGIDELRSALFTLVPEPPGRTYRTRRRCRRRLPRLPPRAEGPRRGAFCAPRTASASSGTPPSEEELERALREAGARRGVEVQVGEESFEFVP